MKEKNIVVWLIVSILTCGIGGLVWFVSLTDDIALASEDHSVSGGMALLLTIVTCGIYRIYWNYKMGKLLYEAEIKREMNATDNSVLYLVLAIFGLDIVNYCIMQSELNKMAN